MTQEIRSTQWVYVIIRNPGTDEQIVGQYDEKADISFVPIFLEKEAALQGALTIPLEKDRKHEVQAIIYEDLERYSAQNGFLIFVLGGDGRITQKVVPDI